MPSNRAVAELFKLELSDMLSSWSAAQPVRSGAPHASAILARDDDWCLRRHVLTALYPDHVQRLEEKPWTAAQNAIFLHGWSLHEKYQKLFQRHGNVLEVETSHYDETRFLHFTPDAIIEFGGLPYIVEIKGYKQEHWDKLDEAGEPPEAAWMQCNLYCHLLDIERGIVLVENKDTQEVKVWVIQRDPELARRYTDRCYAVKGRVTTQHLPARVCAQCTERRAQACPVRDLCFSLEENA